MSRPGEANQRVAITMKGRPQGVFVLTPLQPGFLKRDSGTHEHSATWGKSGGRHLPLDAALQLVHLYAERGSPKYEKAALRWLERHLTEGAPRLQHFAEITATLADEERT